MLVIYSNASRVIVCTQENEQEVIKEYFTDCGIDYKNEYDREVMNRIEFVASIRMRK